MIERLDHCSIDLQNFISRTEIEDDLIQRQVISKLHKEKIKSELTPYSKAQELLNIIRRRSMRQYHSFINYLREKGYSDSGISVHR